MQLPRPSTCFRTAADTPTKTIAVLSSTTPTALVTVRLSGAGLCPPHTSHCWVGYASICAVTSLKQCKPQRSWSSSVQQAQRSRTPNSTLRIEKSSSEHFNTSKNCGVPFLKPGACLCSVTWS